MKLISTSWSCQRCGGAFISTPPEHGLCDQCIADLEAVASAQLPETVTCPSCGGPVCPDCGDAMVTVLVSVPASAPASVTEQAARLIAGYRAHRQEVTGDDH
jgi:predicted amidophosphoribosyltransferase